MALTIAITITIAIAIIVLNHAFHLSCSTVQEDAKARSGRKVTPQTFGCADHISSSYKGPWIGLGEKKLNAATFLVLPVGRITETALRLR